MFVIVIITPHSSPIARHRSPNVASSVVKSLDGDDALHKIVWYHPVVVVVVLLFSLSVSLSLGARPTWCALSARRKQTLTDSSFFARTSTEHDDGNVIDDQQHRRCCCFLGHRLQQNQNATTNNNNNNNKNVKQDKLKQLRRSLTIVNVATPSKKSSAEPPKEPKRSAVEIIKENSDFLRHPLIEQLATPETFISEDAAQLYKFHGGYQQDDREKRSFGEGKFYQFMMRTKQPAGLVPNKLYLTMDDLANTHGNGTLRLTTRQTYQLHGILKQDLKQRLERSLKTWGPR